MAHLLGYCVFLGKTADRSATSVALQEAKELVKAFGTRSSRVPRVLSMMDSLFNKLQPQVRSTLEICDRKNCRMFSQQPNVSVSRATFLVLMSSWTTTTMKTVSLRLFESLTRKCGACLRKFGPAWLKQGEWNWVKFGLLFFSGIRIFFFLKRGEGGMYNLTTVSMRLRGLY